MFGVLCHDILALLHIGCVNNSLLLSGALLLLVELLLCMAGTLLLRHLLHHSMVLGHRMYGTLLLMLNHIVSDMLGMTDRHSLLHKHKDIHILHVLQDHSTGHILCQYLLQHQEQHKHRYSASAEQEEGVNEELQSVSS